jgi:hypothetical protein
MSVAEDRSFIRVAKRLTLGVVIAAGIASLAFVIFVLILTKLPRTNYIRMEAFQEFQQILNLLKNKQGTPPTPDSPIVVRGGSANFFANPSEADKWKDYNNQGYLFYSKAGEVPNTLFIHGIFPMPVPSGSSAYPEHTTFSTSSTGYNWAITLAFKSTDGNGNPYRVYICSALTTKGAQQVCDTDANGSIDNSNKVFIQADLNTLSPASDDQNDKSARFHYSVPGCTVKDDSKCDKIDYMVVQDGPSSQEPSSKYKCVDGGCSIAISNSP